MHHQCGAVCRDGGGGGVRVADESSAELGDAVTLRGEVRLNSSSCALACFPQVDACCGWSLHPAFYPYCYYNIDCQVYAPTKSTEGEYEYAHACRK
jgi:hypothetical protein